MKRSKRTWLTKAAFLSPFVIGFVYLAYHILTAAYQGFSSLKEHLPSTYILNREDSALFAASAIRDFSIDEVRHSKVRGDVSFLTYNEIYDVVIHSFPVKDNFRLDTCFQLRELEHDRTLQTTYSTVLKNSFKISIKVGAVYPASKMLLLIQGRELKQIEKSDSLILLQATGLRFSIQLDDQPVDFSIESKSEPLNTKPIHLEAAFIRGDKKVTLVILAPKFKTSDAPTLLLPELLR